jgi:hypothetical protein
MAARYWGSLQCRGHPLDDLKIGAMACAKPRPGPRSRAGLYARCAPRVGTCKGRAKSSRGGSSLDGVAMLLEGPRSGVDHQWPLPWGYGGSETERRPQGNDTDHQDRDHGHAASPIKQAGRYQVRGRYPRGPVLGMKYFTPRPCPPQHPAKHAARLDDAPVPCPRAPAVALRQGRRGKWIKGRDWEKAKPRACDTPP